jgi:drug/metabolite transporter (DMT)-like permease
MVLPSEYISLLENKDKKIYKGFIVSFIGIFIISFDSLLIRLVTSNISVWTLLCFRYIFFTISCFLYNLYKEKGNILKEIYNLGKIGILGIIIVSTCYFSFTNSIIYTKVANTLCIYSLSPIFTSLLSYIILRENIKWWTWVSLIICTTTVIIVIFYDINNSDNNKYKYNTFGCIIGGVGMICTSGYYTLFRFLKLHEPEKKLDLITFCAGFLTSSVSLIVALIQKNSLYINYHSILWLMLQGSIVISVSYITITYSSKYISSTENNLMVLLDTVLGPLWVYLCGIEPPPKLTIIGIVIITTLLVINGILSIRYDTNKKIVSSYDRI